MIASWKFRLLMGLDVLLEMELAIEMLPSGEGAREMEKVIVMVVAVIVSVRGVLLLVGEGGSAEVNVHSSSVGWGWWDCACDGVDGVGRVDAGGAEVGVSRVPRSPRRDEDVDVDVDLDVVVGRDCWNEAEES